jgi:ATP-binding cassette, subfamily B, bacterial
MSDVKIRSVLREFWVYIKPYKWWMALFGLMLIAATILTVIIPLYYKKLFDTIASGSSADEAVLMALVGIVFTILVINIIKEVFYRISGFVDAYTSTHITEDMDEGVFDRLQKHSYKFYTDNFAGGLMQKIKRFSQSYNTLSMIFFWNLLSLLILMTGSMYILFLRNIWLGTIMLVSVAGIISANLAFSIWKLKFDEIRAQKDSKASGILVDSITNNINVKLFSSRKHELALYSKARGGLRKAEMVSWLLAEGSFGLQALLFLSVEFAVMYVAVHLWRDGLLTIGDFALIQAYVIGLMERIWNIGRSMRRVYEAFADAKEMVEILETPIDVKDKPTAKQLKVTNGEVKFNNVDFNYNQTRKTLQDFNVTIQPGERVALVGPSGAGKSTMVKLLMRFHDVTSGKILIDDQNIADVYQDSLREEIGFVPQDPILFHRTLKENIRYGKRNATDKEVITASKLARCHDFIKDLPEGYKTYVGERGIKLSGGERQRVAIARAILKNAPILILDEATSSLDSESEALIQDALKILMKDKTVIVIAHRLSTIMQMDRIIVVDKGKVMDEGTHQELLKHKGLYQKLWSIQAGSFMK